MKFQVYFMIFELNIWIFEYHCLLQVSKHSKEGGDGELVFIYPEGSQEITWYNPTHTNITTCYIKSLHCIIPTNPNYIVTVNNESSRLVIEESRYKEHDGFWMCSYRTQRLNGNYSIKFFVASLPKAFMFNDPPKLGFQLDGHALHLVATANCIYPQPDLRNVVLHYRIENEDTFQQFTKRKPNISSSHNPNCDQHEYDLQVQIDILMTDFNETNVIFQFLYVSVSGDVTRTKDIIFLKFGGTKWWLVPVIGVIVIVMIGLVIISVKYFRSKKNKKEDRINLPQNEVGNTQV
ncbi:uncharacterized protein LOC134237154 [Saccostrea cucullata]|uniref:uncharacterized protein LOC134237154 n=1 Tax=Saccostrea cuccullata TaxID=36930 RepID=UPI002ED289C0